MKKHKPIQVGDVFPTNEGGSVVVVEYRGYSDISVMHLDANKHISKTQGGRLRNGEVKNPFWPSAMGIGYIGVGPHAAHDESKQSKAYSVWMAMLNRCYSKAFHMTDPTYSECTVCSEWHNFQVFAEWFSNKPHSDIAGFEIDKDLIELGNKEYGPHGCSLVPKFINTLLVDRRNKRGDLPQGVKSHGKGFSASFSANGKRVHLGTYATIDAAQSEYASRKQEYVRQTAEEYKAVLHPKVYENLRNWTL